jgi:PDZ domain-containing secreted protein
MVGEEVAKKTRRPNYTDAEQLALANAVKDNEHILFGKFSNTVTKTSKKQAWLEVRDAVNAVGDNARTVDEVSTKYKNMKTGTKKIESSNRRESNKTGAGTAMNKTLSTSQRIVLSTIPETAVSGIPGGIDLHDPSCKFLIVWS